MCHLNIGVSRFRNYGRHLANLLKNDRNEKRVKYANELTLFYYFSLQTDGRERKEESLPYDTGRYEVPVPLATGY